MKTISNLNIWGSIKISRNICICSSKINRGFSTFNNHNSRNSSAPLIDKYRSSWPDVEYNLSKQTSSPSLPKRTVPDHVLRFRLSATFDHNSSIFYPHLNHNPADFKVTLEASVDKLGLDAEVLPIFIQMLGKRYNQGKREFRLISSRFPNRIENKKYLTLLLEKLILEAKELNKNKSKYD